MLNQFFLEAFLDNEETRKLFHQYLIDSKTEEPLLFIEAVEKYQVLKSDVNRYSTALKIISTYLESGSEQEINLSDRVKQRIISEFSVASPTSCSRLLFDHTMNEIILQLKQDSFKRFLASSLWSKFLQNKQHELSNEDTGEEQLENFIASLTIYDPSLFSTHAALIPENVSDIEESKSKYEDDDFLNELTQNIKIPYTGLIAKDLKVKLKTYHSAFRGKDIITWIASHLKVDREEAITIARILQRKRRIFERLDHKKSSGSFKLHEVDEDDRIYRFSASARSVVIIGAGFAGTAAARILEDIVDVTIIDIRPYMILTPMIVNTISDPSYGFKFDHHACLMKSKVIISRAVDISVEEKCVTLDTKNHETIPSKVPFDALIIATGMKSHVPFPVQTSNDCNIIDGYDPESIVRSHNAMVLAKKIAVVGAGQFGIEIACECAAKFKSVQVIIISKDRALLLGGDEENEITETVRSNLKKFKNITVVHGTVSGIVGRTITYANSTDNTMTLDSDVIFLCTGRHPNSDIVMKSMSHILDDNDRIRVNSRFQVFKADQSDDTTSSTDTSSSSEIKKQYYKHIYAIGGVSSNVDSFKNSLVTIRQA